MDYEKLLLEIKANIELHNQFRKAYDKQMAFDFNLFNFFDVGENKLSELLAFFINPESSHGQGDVFLEKFLDVLNFNVEDSSISEIKCEKTIENNRRIDLFIRFKSGEILAIENKVWAQDQYNQLIDYAKFIGNQSNDKYLLIYLNPYGHDPSEDSISMKEREKLTVSGKFRVIKYTEEIIDVINAWISVSEADNVAFFLKQFREHITTRFLGRKIDIMDSKIEELIYKNVDEVSELVNAYRALEKHAQKRFDEVVRVLKAMDLEHQDANEIKSAPVGPFSWYGDKVFKVYVEHEKNAIWIEVVRSGIFVYSHYYFESTTDEKFKSKLPLDEFNENKKLITELNNGTTPEILSVAEIIEIFLAQLDLAKNAFAENI